MSYPNKANALVAIIILAACTISISAQTPVTGGSLTVKPDSTRATTGSAVEKTEVLPVEGADSTARPGGGLAVVPRSEVSDSTRAHLNTIPDEGRSETRSATSTSPQAASTDTWQFQLTPYLWIPTISGRAGIGNLITDTTTSVGDSSVELNFGFMGTFEARKNRFIILTDLQYSDIATEKGNPGPLFSSSRASFKTFVLDPEIGYRVLDNGKGATLDVLGGLRYWHLNANLAFSAGILPAVEVSRSRSWVDGVVGLRGKAALSQRWFITGKADLGGGGSKFTWQFFGGGGYNVKPNIALIFGYRVLDVDYNKNNFVYDMNQRGPIFGLGFKF